MKRKSVSRCMGVALATVMVAALAIMPAPARAAPGVPDHFRLELSLMTLPAGTAVTLTVTVEDEFNDTIIDYTGITYITCNDLMSDLPDPYTWTGAEGGTANFSVTLYKVIPGWNRDNGSGYIPVFPNHAEWYYRNPPSPAPCCHQSRYHGGQGGENLYLRR